MQTYSVFIRAHLTILKTDILVSDLLPEITKEGLLCLSYLFLDKVEKDLVPLGLLSFKVVPVRYFAVQYLGEFCDLLGRTNEDNIVSVSYVIIFVAF